MRFATFCSKVEMRRVSPLNRLRSVKPPGKVTLDGIPISTRSNRLRIPFLPFIAFLSFATCVTSVAMVSESADVPPALLLELAGFKRLRMSTLFTKNRLFDPLS